MINPELIYRKMMMSNHYPSREETLAIIKQLIAANAVIEAIKIAKVSSIVECEIKRFEEVCR